MRSGGSGGLPIRASLAAWYRKGVGFTTATGVSQWADQSGNGRHLAQATGSKQPALQGDGTLLFDGSADALTVAFSNPAPFTVYLRMKQVTWTLNDYVFDSMVANRAAMRQQTATPALSLFAQGVNAAENTALAVDTWGSVAAVFNGASSVLQINSTTTTGDPGSAAASDGFTLGASGGGLGQFSNIQVAEVAIYAAAHNATERSLMMAYFDTK